MENATDIIKEGMHIVIVDNSRNRRVYIAQKGKKVQHYKNNIDMSSIIGKNFNQFFQIVDNKAGTLIEVNDHAQLVKEFFLTIDGGNEDEDDDDQEDGEDLEVTKHRRLDNMNQVPDSHLIKINNDFEVKGDNRMIFDDTNQQKLTETGISELKK